MTALTRNLGFWLFAMVLGVIMSAGAARASQFTEALTKDYFELARLEYYYSDDRFAVKPKPMAKPKPEPAPPTPRSFIVFFDWDAASLGPDARRVLETAAAYAKERGLARVNLVGHADRSGAAKYNLGLLLRRADAVKAALVGLGLGAADVSVTARGEAAPLVDTADGVREPRNRRVEISF